MSIHFSVSELAGTSLDDWRITACAWRGCCLELFSRAEHAIDDCLLDLARAGLASGRDAYSPAPLIRLRELDRCLGAYRLSGHEKEARKRLAIWARIHENRAPLAHGRIVVTEFGVTIHHRTFDGKSEISQAARRLSSVEMVAQLSEIEDAQSRLQNQLGQIKAAAGQATPLPAS